MLDAAQQAGTVRADVGRAEVGAEVKALMLVCKSSGQQVGGVADRVAEIIVDGLRAAR